MKDWLAAFFNNQIVGRNMIMMFMTLEEAEEIAQVAQIGMYELNYPGNRSKLAHARLLIAANEKSISSQRTDHEVSGTVGRQL